MKLELKMSIVLVATALAAAVMLGVVFAFTSPTIAAQKEAARQEALKAIMPAAKEFKPDTVVTGTDTSVIYIAYDKSGQRMGLVFTAARRGYGGPVETMVGINQDSSIAAIRIASASEGLKETPGLGTRVLEDWFTSQFKGQKHDQVYLTKEGGKIQGITAATISSNAVTSGVRLGLGQYLPYLYDASSIAKDSLATVADTSDS